MKMKTTLRVLVGCIMLISVVAVSSADNAAYDEAAGEVTLLLQKGQDQQGCADLAQSIADEVTNAVSEVQKILNNIENGSSCAQEADEATGLSDAQGKRDSTAKASADAAAAVTGAENTPVDFGTIQLNTLKSKSCAQFFEDPAYTAVKKQVADAKIASAKAAGAAEAAAEALKTVQAAADEAKKVCLCKVRDAYDPAWKNANANHDDNAAAWKKAANMKCVLAGTAIADCQIPDTPKVAALTLDAGVPKTSCQVHCEVSEWDPWGDCDKTCGGGMQSRSRTITTETAYGGSVCPALKAEQSCNLNACPIDCKVSGYGQYMSCTKACGGGTKEKYRSITQATMHGGKSCPGLVSQTSCNPQQCPVNCVMSSWGSWGSCSKQCGSGSQSKSRSTQVNAAYGGTPCGEKMTSQNCNTHQCPIDCKVSGWKPWSGCSKQCGGGKKSKFRTVTTNSAFGGKACPILTAKQNCNTGECAVHCKVSAWSQWEQCSKECGSGTQTKSRSIVTGQKYGGRQCPDLKESQDCNTSACPVDCVVNQWSPWNKCTKECGGGTKLKTRKVQTAPKYGGRQCPDLSESLGCNSHLCPVDCKVGSWGPFGTCSKYCGAGSKTKSRTVTVSSANGGATCPTLIGKGDCNNGGCPVDCITRAWGGWGSCSKSCGGGTQKRSRSISANAINGGSCPALTDSKTCNTGSCGGVLTLSATSNGYDGGGCQESYSSEFVVKLDKLTVGIGEARNSFATPGTCSTFYCNTDSWCPGVTGTSLFSNRVNTVEGDQNGNIKVDYTLSGFESDASDWYWRRCLWQSGDDCHSTGTGSFDISIADTYGSQEVKTDNGLHTITFTWKYSSL